MSKTSVAFNRIRQFVRRTRHRLIARAGLITGGWLLSFVGGFVLSSLLAASLFENSLLYRIIVVSTLICTALGVIILHFLRPLFHFRSNRVVAEHIENHISSLKDGLLASVQFSREWGHRAFESPQLITALAAQVQDTLAQANQRHITPMTPARRPWMFAGIVAIAWLIAALAAAPTLKSGLQTWMPDAVLGAAQEAGPLVGDLVLTLTFPEHVHRPDKVVPNSSGHLEAPKGTRITLTATTLAPAHSVMIRFGEGESTQDLPLHLVDGRDASGVFVLDKAEVWRFVVAAPDGQTLVETAPRRLKIEIDRPPTVTLHLPAEDVVLEDLRAVPVRFEARDDFGLSTASVVIALAADPDHPEKLEQVGVKGSRYTGDDEVDLTMSQAQPGDRIALMVEAFDNNAVDGPQRGTSVTRYITVHSPQAKHYALSESLRETIDQLLDALADRLEFNWAAQPLPAQLAKLSEASSKAASALATIVEQMSDDPLTPKEVRLALTGRLGALEEALTVERAGLETQTVALEAREGSAVRLARRNNEGVIDQLEQAIILVEAMVARLAMEDMAALTDELKAAREQLREMILAYKDNPSDALKARIMRDIQRLRQRMREIRERMAQLRQKLPEEFLNMDGLKDREMAKGLEKTQNQLDDLEKMLEEGRVDDALTALEEMEQALDELSATLDKDMQTLHSESNPKMQKAISELMDQTRDVMKRQQALSAETQQQAQAQAEAQRKVLEEDMAEQLEAVRKKAAELDARSQAMDPNAFFGPGAEELGHLKQRTSQLKGALERSRLLEGMEMAERALDHLDSMARFSQDGLAGRQRMRQNQDLADEIIRGLDELIESARAKSEAASTPGQSQELAEQQQQLGQAVGKLSQRISKQGQQIPGMGDKPGERADRAGKAMRQAAERLQRGDAGQARSGQQEAMSELQALMEGLKNANKPQRAGRRQQGHGPKPNQERVPIPTAEDYQAPAAFRKELMDAMKGKAPEPYREQVKRYYESLVR